jgi:hypothetical protein
MFAMAVGNRSQAQSQSVQPIRLLRIYVKFPTGIESMSNNTNGDSARGKSLDRRRPGGHTLATAVASPAFDEFVFPSREELVSTLRGNR